jgi:hypothetical protein
MLPQQHDHSCKQSHRLFFERRNWERFCASQLADKILKSFQEKSVA